MEQLVHGAKQTANAAPPTTTIATQPQVNEVRPAQGNEVTSTSNAEAGAQLSTAPPGTGPLPTLTETPEVPPVSEASRTNGKCKFVLVRQLLNFYKLL